MSSPARWPIIWLLVFVTYESTALRCEKVPEGLIATKSHNNGRYRLDIPDTSEYYEPNKKYTITVHSVNEEQSRFREFILLAEQGPSTNGQSSIDYVPSVGTFDLDGSKFTKFSDKCPNTITQTNFFLRNSVEVVWTAPPHKSGCVALRATVAETKERWYNDEHLEKVLCEETVDSDDKQPPVNDFCGACHEAKYEVAFERLWSRNTHPKDYPENKWDTRFSDVIGASHTVDYQFWSVDEIASKGLKEVAETGNTRELEGELKNNSEHIRTIIKARGVNYPNVTGKTFAVFRVDKQHHLMSLVSKIYPSPDWFVGVTQLELCTKDGEWLENKVLNLYPIDAGTDDGITYNSTDQPTLPQHLITKITSDFPDNPHSPFFDKDGEQMKPLARLTLTRQRLYEKSCSHINNPYSNNSNLDGGVNCQVTPWSDWSPCSATCGKGVKYKQRSYINEESKQKCNVVLTHRSTCYNDRLRECRNNQQFLSSDDGDCELTRWGSWSTCSVECGIGTMTRSRRYKNRAAAKKCAAGKENPPKLEDNLPCHGEGQECNAVLDPEELDCPDTQWTAWDPCSVTCGKGIKSRYRISSTEGDQQATLMQQRKTFLSSFEDGEQFERDQKNEYSNSQDPCLSKSLVEVVECYSDDRPTCDDMPEIDGDYDNNMNTVITDPPSWTAEVVNCKVSSWSPWSTCKTEGPCGSGIKIKHRYVIQESFNGGRPCPSLSKEKKCRISCKGEKKGDSLENHNEGSCIMGEWLNWSPCSESCGRAAKQIRTRNIIRYVESGGVNCSFRTESRDCNLMTCPE